MVIDLLGYGVGYSCILVIYSLLLMVIDLLGYGVGYSCILVISACYLAFYVGDVSWGRTILDVPIKSDMSWDGVSFFRFGKSLSSSFGANMETARLLRFGMIDGVLGVLLSNIFRLEIFLMKAPNLPFVSAPNLEESWLDLPLWRDFSGRLSNFCAKFAWEALRPRASYFIWVERNNCLFKNVRRTQKELCDIIMITVRLKLLTFRFKNTSMVNELLTWKMPSNFRLYG
nr:reverse transcriptase zinc-binding domain-containing protein [Tanacetum cinerariifolium]